jgi:hypothetical protein
MQWLNHTTAVTDLTANPWNCDCSVLLEVWRGLKHKLILQCASPRELEGKSWDEMEGFCRQVAEDKQSMFGGISILMATLIVVGVLVVCAIVLGLVLTKVVKSRRNEPKKPEYDDVYAPKPSRMSLHLYEEVSEWPSHVTDQTYTDVGKKG